MAETLAVGFFDGVHLGHQSILSGADEALTFRNHPLSVLAPARAPRLIMSFEDRIAAIRACGIRRVTVLDFTRELAAIEPKDFAATHLKGRRIRCGANWRFGRGGRGDATFLRELGCEVTVVPAVTREGVVSSTRIRAAIESGRIGEASAMLGRPFCVRGTSFAGKGEGRALGYPTVNLRLEGLSLRLPRGVYAVEAAGRRGLANYGCAPTFGARAWEAPVLEIHFTDQPSTFDLQPSTVSVQLLRFIRPERKFATVEDLKAQIAEDFASERDA